MSAFIDVPSFFSIHWLVMSAHPTPEVDPLVLFDDWASGRLDAAQSTRIRTWLEQFPPQIVPAPPHSLPEGSPGILPTTDFGLLERSRLERATNATYLVCAGRPDLGSAGFEAALAMARAVAHETDGLVLDPLRMVCHAVRSREEAPPIASELVLEDWFGVLLMQGEHGMDLRTAGLERFGVPELLLPAVPHALELPAIRALDGVARALIEAAAERVRAGRSRLRLRRLEVRTGHVARALGASSAGVRKGRFEVAASFAAEQGVLFPLLRVHAPGDPWGDPNDFAFRLAMELGVQWMPLLSSAVQTAAAHA